MMDASADITRQRRLLVVDDSRLILEMLQDFFSPRGFAVEQAEGAEEALEILDRSMPDVVVADVVMPGMDGWAFYHEVRKRPGLEEIPFVFLTTESGLPKRLHGLGLGADDYVVKPFHVEELHARVEKILGQRERLERARAGTDALLAGSVEHLGIADLLQILALNGRDGIVRLRQGDLEGRIVFESGAIVDASCGPVSGVKALFRMLGWEEAVFQVFPREGEVSQRTIRTPTTNVLMDGLVSLDEWKRWRELLPPPGTRLRPAADAKHRTGEEELSPAEADAVARTGDDGSVGSIIDGSPLPDAEVAEAICTLLSRGILETVG
jgi:CheY-like chemotaxis protein